MTTIHDPWPTVRRRDRSRPEIRAVREDLGFTQIAFARLIGRHPSTLNNAERGRTRLDLPGIQAVLDRATRTHMSRLRRHVTAIQAERLHLSAVCQAEVLVRLFQGDAVLPPALWAAALNHPTKMVEALPGALDGQGRWGYDVAILLEGQAHGARYEEIVQTEEDRVALALAAEPRLISELDRSRENLDRLLSGLPTGFGLGDAVNLIGDPLPPGVNRIDANQLLNLMTLPRAASKGGFFMPPDHAASARAQRAFRARMEEGRPVLTSATPHTTVVAGRRLTGEAEALLRRGPPFTPAERAVILGSEGKQSEK